MSEAIRLVSQGGHDPQQAHHRIRSFYSWDAVAERTEVVYRKVHDLPELSLWDRLQKYDRGPLWIDKSTEVATVQFN